MLVLPWGFSHATIRNRTVRYTETKSFSYLGGDKKAINAMYDNKSVIIAVYQMGERLHFRYIDAGNDEQRL